MAFVSLVSQRRVLPTVGGVSLTDVPHVPHVPRARETLKASRPGKLAKLGVVLVFAGVSSNKNRWRRMQRWRIKVNATKRLASLPPLPEERELELKKNIRKAKMVKRRPADQKPWRFAARGGRWQEAIGLLRNSVIPVEAKDYHFLITACVKAGAWSQAVQLLQEMTPLQFRPDAPCFSSLIHAVEHLDDPKEALKNVIDMAPELDAKGFAAVLAACQRLDMVEGLDFLKTVLDQQMPLSEASYIHGINLCARYGEWELSLAALHEKCL